MKEGKSTIKGISRLFIVCLYFSALVTNGDVFAETLTTDDFVITVKTDNPGTSSDIQFTIPTYPYGPFAAGYAIFADNPTVCNAINHQDNLYASITNSGLFSNSNCISAINIEGNATLDTSADISAVGGINIMKPENVTAAEIVSGAVPIEVEMIGEPDCTGLPERTFTGQSTLEPGVYPGGIIFPGLGTWTMNPGLYCLDDDFRIFSGELTGDGVMIFQRGGNISLNGGLIDLQAAQAGEVVDGAGVVWDGMLAFQAYHNSGEFILNSNAGSYYQGTIFVPDGHCRLNGVGASSPVDIQVVCDTIEFKGSADLIVNYNPVHQYNSTPAESYNYNVDCDGDGIDEAVGRTGNYTCTYTTAGTYTIRISDNAGDGSGFPRIYFNDTGDKDKLLSLDQWGSGKWASMAHAFHGCENLTYNAPDAPDLSVVTDLSYMFSGAANIDPQLGGWDVTSIRRASQMFADVQLSTANYDALLNGWNAQTLQSNVAFDGGNSTYCAGEAARANMISLDNWTITDGGKDCTELIVGEMFYSQAAYDGWVLESGENTNKGGLINTSNLICNVGDDAQNKQYRTILHFNTSRIPDTAVVTQVTLQYKQHSIIGSDPYATHGNIWADIKDGYFSNNAALVVSDFAAGPSLGFAGNFSLYPSSLAYPIYRTTLKDTALPYINLDGITQFRLRFAVDDDNDNTADYLKIFCGDMPVPFNRPVLRVWYYVP